MDWNTAQQFVRILLQFGAGLMVNNGLITADMQQTLIGGLMSLIGVAWWIIWDRKRKATATVTPAA